MNIFRMFIRFGSLFKKDLIYVIGVAALLNFIFGILFYFTERGSQDITILDSLWWAVVTMTTVGYGDFYAKTFVGRFVISYSCMIIGIGIIGYLVGIIANILIEFASRNRRGLMDVTCKDHILICGFPNEKKIQYLINEFKYIPEYSKSDLVLVTDKIEELPENIKDKIQFVKGAPTDLDILHKANVRECTAVFIFAEEPHDPRSDERTFVIGALIETLEQELDRDIKTIAEVVDSRSIRNMKKMTINGCVTSDGMVTRLMVQELLKPGIAVLLSKILRSDDDSETVRELKRIIKDQLSKDSNG